MIEDLENDVNSYNSGCSATNENEKTEPFEV